MFDSLVNPDDSEAVGPDGPEGCGGYVDVSSWKVARVAGRALLAVEADQRQGELEVVAAARALELVEDLQVYGQVDDLDASDALDRVAAGQRRINLAQAEQLALAAHWADLHGACVRSTRTAGSERLVQRGGSGTPEVAEFAAAELGAVLGVSTGSAGFLIADALDLRHRLPLLWARLRAGDVKMWIARRIAQRTRWLTEAAAATVDGSVAGLASTLPYGRLEKVLDAAVLAADPPQAKTDTRAVAETRGVWVGDVLLGHQTVFGRADAPDIAALDTSLDGLARAMAVLGDTDSHDIRRAKALGVLADPAAALDLTRLANQALNAPDAAGPRRGCDLGRAVLYLHLGPDLFDGVARVHGIGPALGDQVRDWLGHRHVTIKPVIDIAGMAAVDSYEVPARMAEASRLRTPADCFPYSPNLTLHGDTDHTLPYVSPDDGGPPGQTAVANLAWMTRRTHRVKTHSQWKVTQPRSGVWIWRSPHGHHYLVDHTGTTPLGKL